MLCKFLGVKFRPVIEFKERERGREREEARQMAGVALFRSRIYMYLGGLCLGGRSMVR